MFTQLTRRFSFSASHTLENAGIKCKNMHGHNYECALTLRGTLPETGYLYDLEALKEYVGSIVEELDHSYLNDTIREPTIERISVYLYTYFKYSLDTDYKIRVEVAETKNNIASTGDF